MESQEHPISSKGPISTVEWANSLVGRDWEVFWKQEDSAMDTSTPSHEDGAKESRVGENSSVSEASVSTASQSHNVQSTQSGDNTVCSGDGTTHAYKADVEVGTHIEEEDGDDDEEEDHEDDWYDARIEAFDGVDESGAALFRLSFVGEEKEYVMKLNPTIVRPSAEAWIARTKAMLAQRNPEIESCDNKKWFYSLPAETATIYDQSALDAVDRETRSKDLYTLSALDPNSFVPPSSVPSPEVKDLEAVCDLCVLIRRQLILRAGLTVVENKEDEGPSKKYVDFLCDCLRSVESACLWYHRCWRLHGQVLQSMTTLSSEESGCLSREILLRDYLARGRILITSLALMDTSVLASKRRRKDDLQGETQPSRRTKRRKKKRGFTVSEQEGTPLENSFSHDAVDEVDFLLKDVVISFADRVRSLDSRWYTDVCGTMIVSLSGNIVVPLENWIKLFELYLGKSQSEEGVNELGDSGEESDVGAGGDAILSSGARNRKYIKYEDIEMAITSIENSLFLRSFTLSDFAERLRQKLKRIIDFEQEACEAIGLLQEESQSVILHDNDSVLKKLKELREIASGDSSQVANVDPIGRSSSKLNHAVLQHSIDFRSWFLDLKRAETIRERTAFVKSLFKRFSNLPNIPDFRPLGAGSDPSNISSRIKAVVSRCDDLNSTLFEPTLARALDRSGLLLTVEGVREALGKLRASKYISIAEEVLSARLDILVWKAEATSFFNHSNLDFERLQELKVKADIILDGASESRTAAISTALANPVVDAQVRDHIRGDLVVIAGTLKEKVETIHASAAGWKERADAVVHTLRVLGNPLAGEPLHSAKPPVMVDLKRIMDLILEYESVGVSFDDLFAVLSSVSTESIAWSKSTTETLLDATLSIERCLEVVSDAGQRRPQGIIVDPTRHVIDSLQDLLSWYISLKNAAIADGGGCLDRLLVEGAEILDKFSLSEEAECQLTVSSMHILELLSSRTTPRITSKVISVAKLESNTLCASVLSRLVDRIRDAKEGFPLLNLLRVYWLLMVQDFTQRVKSSATNRESLSLPEARALYLSSPRPTGSDNSWQPISITAVLGSDQVENLKNLIDEADKNENQVKAALQRSKTLLKGVLTNDEEVAPHLATLKDLLGDCRGRLSTAGSLVLDPSLEKELDRDTKLFSWLSRVCQYPILLKREAEDEVSAPPSCSEVDTRIPWETLVALKERIPGADVPGDFAYVVLRVQELYDAAQAWQREISELTMLSLRGAKRRGQATSPSRSGCNVDEDDGGQNQVDLDKVSEMSHNPILSKVAMPREHAIRNMLENTKLFEIQLHEFLGRDYEGSGLDKAIFPKAESLVGKDGSFIIYRLTGSPMWGNLKESIEVISGYASDVFAATPGKATFDWIVQAVSWIESLNASVARLDSGDTKSRLVIHCAQARRLLSEGETILLAVPDDLRQTLSKHKIYVSTNKEGKMKVKSKKGGAHHAVGVTVIRWCPLLFDSLKADCLRLAEWERSLGSLADSFMKFCRQPPGNHETLLMEYHRFYDEISFFLDEVLDLVVYPSATLIDSTIKMLSGVASSLGNSTPEIAQKYAAKRYSDPISVVSNRFHLLDALAHRRSLDPSSNSAPAVDSKDGPFRNACRALIKDALLKGLSLMQAAAKDEQAETEAFCAMKALDIEQELYDQYQRDSDFGQSRITPQYREKARALKRSLEDPGNLLFCGQVLADQIEVSRLVAMSSEDLANPKMKRDRAKAVAVAKQSTMLVAPKQNVDEKKSKSQNIPNVAENNTTQVASSADKNSTETSKTEKRQTEHDNIVSSPVSSPEPKPVHRPPPPPSLVASLRKAPNSLTPSNEYLVTNASTGDRFNVSIMNGSRKFTAGFYAEMDEDGSADGLLPESLSEKGRLRIDEFTKFVKGKLGGGRWKAITLRLITFSDRDAREFKKFSKDYEGRQRIAMFTPEQERLVFLVTPKFHRAATSLSFGNSSSTYAVILMRK